MKRELTIGPHSLGDDLPTFITFEAGPTHDNVETAIKLVEEASKAGAQAIKFQIFNAEKLVANKEQLFNYSILKNRETGELEEVSEPLYNILKRRCLTENEWRKVKERSDELKLAFFATIGFEEDLMLMQDLKCNSVKIASADVNHYPLLRLAAKSGMNVQLDTGNSEIDEIKNAVSILESEGCNSIVIHQCPSGYPARLESINLRMIKTLKDTFPTFPIAYSDHTPDADMDIAAVAMGANLIEKTITLDRTTPSVEHVFSLEPSDMQKFVLRIRELETALGSFNREISDKQKDNRKLLRRSPYLITSASSGTLINDLNVEFRRPGLGITPPQWEKMIEERKILHSSLNAGDLLLKSSFE